jgi:hypothetical protein
MASYCVNKKAQSNGDHEVHDLSSTKGCLPDASNRWDLGFHDGCRSAVATAKQYYPQSNGCAHCAPACHTG